VGTSGSATFDPAINSAFFLIVAHDGAEEGSYGESSADVQRPEEDAAICNYPQNLGGVVCE
jgi:hypothetical protein